MDQELFYFTPDAAATSATCMFYGEVGYDIQAAQFVQELNLLKAKGISDVTIHIYSYGGDVFEANAMFNALQNSGLNITTVNDALAASAAAYLFMAGNRAVMAETAVLMIHNPWSLDSSESGRSLLDKLRQNIATTIAKRSGQSAEKVADLMDSESWFTAEEAVTLGFATEIQAIAERPALKNDKVKNLVKIYNKVLKTDKILNMTEAPEVTPEVSESAPEPTPAPEAKATDVPEVTPVAEVPEVSESVTEPTAPTLDAEKEALRLSNEELVRVNADLTARLADVETILNRYQNEEAAKETAVRELRIQNLLDTAVAEGKIAPTARNSWAELAQTSYDHVATAIAGLSVPRVAPKVVDRIKNAMEKQVVGGENYVEMSKKNPDELARIKNEDPERFRQLYYNSYKVYPA